MSSIPNSAMPHAGGRSNGNSRQFEDLDSRSGSNQPGDYSTEATCTSLDRDGGTLMDRARNHKTGIALGMAVGAIAATAIPFMLSGKKRSTAQEDYSTGSQRDINVDTRDSTRLRDGGNQS